MEGAERSGNHLELSVFVEKTRQFLEFLKVSAKDSGEDNAVFDVVGLSHSSPASIDCTPVERSTIAMPPSAIFDGIKEKLDLTERGQTHDLSNPVLSSLEKLANYKPQKIGQIEIHTIAESDEDKRIYVLNDEFKEILREARSGEDKVTSTVDGRLEQINIHNKANSFRIYTFTSSVPCKFPSNLLKDVQGALGNYVSVWGECFYRPNTAFPYKINARKMKVLPPNEELPSLIDLLGIAPGATGDKSSEHFVRELRDEWNKNSQ